MKTLSDDEMDKVYQSILREERSPSDETRRDPGFDPGDISIGDTVSDDGKGERDTGTEKQKVKRRKKEEKGPERQPEIEEDTGATIHEFFNEDEESVNLLRVPEPFSTQSRFNADNIWGKPKRKLFSKNQSRGLRDILIDKTVHKGDTVVITDVILVVRKDIFDRYLAKGSEDVKRLHDEGSEEIAFLAEWADKDILLSRKIFDNSGARNGYRFGFKPVETDYLDEQTIAVVCKKNTFIPDENDTVIADIICRSGQNEITRHFYAGQLHFTIGPGYFDNIVLPKMPRDISLTLFYDTEKQCFKFDHRPVNNEKVKKSEAFTSPGGLLSVINGKPFYLFKEENRESAELVIKVAGKNVKEKDILSIRVEKRDIPEYVPEKEVEEYEAETDSSFHGDDTIQVDYPGLEEDDYFADDEPTIPVETSDREKTEVSRLIRTHRLLPGFKAGYGADMFSACFGGQGDWVVEEKRAKLKVRWDQSEITFRSLDDGLMLDGEPFEKSEEFSWSNDQQSFEVYSEDGFYMHFDRKGVPLFSTSSSSDPENGFKPHLAVMDTEPDFTFSIHDKNRAILIGRGKGCNINTSETEKQFVFNRIASSRFHAVFDPLTETVWNISTQIPVFIFERENNRFEQIKEIKPLADEDLCDDCRKIMEKMKQKKSYDEIEIRRMIVGGQNSTGLLNCSTCSKKRDFACIDPEDYTVVGNAVYKYELSRV